MLNVALIGTGYWGPNLANSVARSGLGQLRWLCDLNPKNMEALAARYRGVKTTTQLAEVLADSTLDAVIISTPTTTHYPIAIQALRADKHVLVEKPITTRSDQAAELARFAADQGCVLMVGHVFEYNAAIRAVDELIKSGDLGEIYYMNFERTNLGPVRTDVSALWDLASHDASIMCDFMSGAPISVTAKGQSYLNAGIEDVVFATFTFHKGVVAHVHASWLNPSKVRRITVIGSKKMVVWDDLNMREPVRLFDKHVAPPLSEITGSYQQHKTLVVDSGVSVPVVQTCEPLLSEIQHFLECIESGQKPRSDGFNALRVVRLLEAAAESIAHDSVVIPIGPISNYRSRVRTRQPTVDAP